MDYVYFTFRLEPTRYHEAQDVADKVNTRISSALLTFIAIIVSTKQYFGESFNCYLSTSEGGEYVQEYVNQYCYIYGIIPMRTNFAMKFPQNDKEWEAYTPLLQRYHIWIPYFIGIMAISVMIPDIFMELLAPDMRQAKNFVDYTYRIEADDKEGIKMAADYFMYNVLKDQIKRDITLKHELLDENDEEDEKKTFRDFFKCHKRMNSKRDILTEKEEGKVRDYRKRIIKLNLDNRMLLYYLLKKALYILTDLMILIFVETYFNDMSEENFYGTRAIKFLILGKDIESSTIFPRVGLCRLKFRILGTVNTFTSQCSIPLNLLLEKVFIFIWFWVLFAMVVVIVSIPNWLVVMDKKKNRKFIKSLIYFEDQKTVSRKKAVAREDQDYWVDKLEELEKLTGDEKKKFRDKLIEEEMKNEKNVDRFIGRFFYNDIVFVVKIALQNSNESVFREILTEVYRRSTDQKVTIYLDRARRKGKIFLSRLKLERENLI